MEFGRHPWSWRRQGLMAGVACAAWLSPGAALATVDLATCAALYGAHFDQAGAEADATLARATDCYCALFERDQNPDSLLLCARGRHDLGNFSSAAHHYNRYLEFSGPGREADDLADVKAWLPKARREVARDAELPAPPIAPVSVASPAPVAPPTAAPPSAAPPSAAPPSAAPRSAAPRALTSEPMPPPSKDTPWAPLLIGAGGAAALGLGVHFHLENDDGFHRLEEGGVANAPLKAQVLSDYRWAVGSYVAGSVLLTTAITWLLWPEEAR